MSASHLFLMPKPPCAAPWIVSLLNRYRTVVCAAALESRDGFVDPGDPRRSDRLVQAFRFGEDARAVSGLICDRVELLQRVAATAAAYLDDATIRNLIPFRDALTALDLHRVAFPE